jgi:hypothetical protein
VKKVAVIMLGGVRQKDLFWPSYFNCDAGYAHDLIIVHRDYLGMPTTLKNNYGSIIIHNKIIDGKDIPHGAFGAYRNYFNVHQNDYEYFIFISDDVILKREYWLKEILKTLDLHDKIGFGASQIFNGHKRYPHESHIRAPFWFAKTKVLKEIKWEFNDDHDGEMKIGDQCASAGYIGVQVGNKIDLGYDATEPSHITQLLEQKYYPELHPFGKHNSDSPDFFYHHMNKLDKETISNEIIISPYSHIGQQNALIDIEPFHNLIYYPSLSIAKKHSLVKELPYNINILCNFN